VSQSAKSGYWQTSKYSDRINTFIGGATGLATIHSLIHHSFIDTHKAADKIQKHNKNST